MRKLVLGIALVICLDVAFILMMANETEVSEMARAVIPNPAVPVNRQIKSLEPVVIHDNEEFVDPDPVRSARSVRYEPRSKSRSVVARRRTSSTRDVPDIPLNTKRLFPDKIIYIGQYEAAEDLEPAIDVSPVKAPLEAKSENSEITPTIKKRSFESRAFGVIKKPYKWIKSLASKLGR